MLHDEPEGIDVDRSLRLVIALEHHALPGGLHLSRLQFTLHTASLEAFRVPTTLRRINKERMADYATYLSKDSPT